MGKIYPVCRHCGQVPQDGLYDGFRLKGVFFCSACWHEGANARPDSELYTELYATIKKILFQ